MIKRALISVYDKSGIEDFTRFVAEKGYGILSTGGTYRALSKAGIGATEVSAYTGAEEILDGRVKTLHPKIHGGLLARRDDPKHLATLGEKGIDPIDVVVVNLYPFFEKAGAGLDTDELVEFIDIGGPTMIRAAAKNHAYVAVISDPSDYGPLMESWDDGPAPWSLATRRRLAGKVFSLTGAYDAAVARSLLDEEEAPPWLSFPYRKEADLRYGENPHQKAAWYVPAVGGGALADFEQLGGKELSFNNLRDLDAAWRAVGEYEDLACVGVKHAAPCGVALGASPKEAWIRAREADPVSIFGGIVAFNREVDEAAAEELTGLFLEVVAAPSFSDGALTVLRKKKNLRILAIPEPASDRWESLPVDGGICLQETDREFVPASEWMVPTKAAPSTAQLRDLDFAWKAVKHVKSNGIVVANGGVTLGIGTGQPNRVGAVRLALAAAGEAAKGAVMASDAFFPFDDAVKEAAEAGIAAVVQPGGSKRDPDSIAACDEAGIAMAFTGRRHFRH